MDLDKQKVEIDLLLEALFRLYGYDFRNYAKAHIRRRILHRLEASGLESISLLQHKILYDQDFLNVLLADLSINVTEMFRDPKFFQAVRNLLVPRLETYPFIKIWHAGCATGEEVYSMAIVLKEEGLLESSQLYATDFSSTAIENAKNGIISTDSVKKCTGNYQKSGGEQSFAGYFTARYEYAKLNESLLEKTTFAEHNLANDSVFGEMNMIICRNVLIYFNKKLQNRVIELFCKSLCPGGFLCLGSKESLQFSTLADNFTPLDQAEKIYMKKYQ